MGKVYNTLKEIHVFDNGIKVYKYHLWETQIERYSTIRNVHEAEEEDIFCNIIQKIPLGGAFINIGSAIGYYPLLARKLRKDIKIYAIEPLSKHRNYFTENICLNNFKFEDFEILDVAIGSFNGYGKIIDKGYGSFILNDNGRQGQFSDNLQEVCILRFDDFLNTLKNNTRVCLCQMDVQGYEYEVLKGARKSIENKLVEVFIIGTHSKNIHEKCKELLEKKGYKTLYDNPTPDNQPDGILVCCV